MLTKKDQPKNEVKTTKNGKVSPPETPTSKPSPSTKDSNATQTATKQNPTPTEKKAPSKTRLTIKYDTGYPNQLYIRGKGANLSWDKGQPLKNVKSDEWVWETDAHFTQCEFKVLINDHVYENGDNHLINAGATLLYTPHFY